jgi:hypothetical protein
VAGAMPSVPFEIISTVSSFVGSSPSPPSPITNSPVSFSSPPSTVSNPDAPPPSPVSFSPVSNPDAPPPSPVCYTTYSDAIRSNESITCLTDAGNDECKLPDVVVFCNVGVPLVVSAVELPS